MHVLSVVQYRDPVYSLPSLVLVKQSMFALYVLCS